LTHAQLAYAYITVKFQLRSYINVRLMESSLYDRFCIERSQKWGFGGNFWGRDKIFGGNPLGMQRPPIYAFSDIFGPDLTRRVVAFCMDIDIFFVKKLAKIWASFGVHSSPTRSRRKTPLPEGTPLDLPLSRGKIEISLRCNSTTTTTVTPGL